MAKDKFYVTTAIDYASGAPHIGHAYEKIAADVIARWNRNIGKIVYFQTGTDEHGQKIVEKAQEAKKEPQEFVDLITRQFENMLPKLDISNDFFIRTTDEKHKELVREILQKSFDNGDIYKDVYDGLYCVGCERYYDEGDLLENLNGERRICPDHKREVEHKKEENYFFKLSKYEKELLQYYEKNSDFISPESKRKEILNRVKEGLRDISISRPKDSLSWGIELPFDSGHVTYVWFDALFNYYTGTRINDKEDFWPADVHIVGHDISWFHIVYWPAFLMSVGLDLSKKVFSHGMVLDGEGHKMSKSLGNVVDPLKFSRKYGVDEFRYFLMAVGTFGDDICFSEEKFAEKINNELNNDLGNLVSRVHAMTNKYFDGIVQGANKLEEVDHEFISHLNIFEKFNSNLQELKFNQATENLWNAVREANAYINKVAPWKEEDRERLGTVLNILISSVRMFAEYVDCFMPTTAQRIFKQYNIEKSGKFEFDYIESGHELGEKDNLFTKIKLEKKEENPKDKKVEEKREGFATLNLKVGKIISARQHPEADKLYIEEIDVGEENLRQIVSGLKNFYNLEELEGRKVVIAANLKPAKLRGVKSEGMVLVSEREDESQVGFLQSDADVGTNLQIGDVVADNPSRIKIDDFFKIKMTSDGEKVYFDSKEIKAGDKELTVDRNIKGNVC